MNEIKVPGSGISKDLLEKAKRELSAIEFGNEIIRLRGHAGLTQKKLASILKVDPAVISRVENGSHSVTLDLVIMLATALNQDPHRLADIYWGIETNSYKAIDKELINKIWLLMLSYFQPDQYPLNTPLFQPTLIKEPPLNDTQIEEVTRMDEHHIRQTRKKKQAIENQIEQKD